MEKSADRTIKRIAVPSTLPGGIDSPSSGHFGRCQCFTIVEVEGNEIKGDFVVSNPPHVNGGCLAPVQLLVSQDIDALVLTGIGARPLAGFEQAGIPVYLGQGSLVRDLVMCYLSGEARVIGVEDTCRGH